MPLSPIPEPDANTLVGVLAEDDRLRTFAALVLGAPTPADIADATGLGQRRIVQALERLGAAGLVEGRTEGGLRARTDVFKAAARRAAAARPVVEPEKLGATPQQADVLRHFMSDDRLTQIPAQRAKRLVVLDFLVQRFEPGKAYPERDVNMQLGLVYADYAALRRYLVDEGFLERRDGFYWRAGGTFEIE